MKPVLGSNIENGHQFKIDLPRLTETRMLIQANSGGGKSYAIRKILEQTHGHIQQIVLDMEGEFSTLREHFDYILAGKEGDIHADPRSADLLARKILELGADLIVDLYELKQRDRIRFVKIFVDSLVNSPKELWHPVLIIIDEAHVFVPEKGESEAMSAVVDLATRGRKRGFCAVLATQRLSKLHKDVAAECLNKLIGRTGLDIDMKRASEELGFSSKTDMLELRNLTPGQFFAFGPAISNEVIQVEIGEVKSWHPKPGQRTTKHIPVPTAKIKQALAKLADLPKEAEQELKDKSQLLQKVRELERDLRAAQKEIKTETKIEKIIDPKAIEREVAKFKKEFQRALLNATKDFMKTVDTALGNTTIPAEAKVYTAHDRPRARPVVQAKAHTKSDNDEEITLGRGERLILKFLTLREGKAFTKTQIGGITGYASNGGSFNTYMSRLKQAGLVEQVSNGLWRVSDVSKAMAVLGDEYHAQDQASLEDWLDRLGGGAKRIYEVILNNRDTTFSREELGEATGMESKGGSFNTYISRLSTLGLLEKTQDGIRLNQELLNV